MAVIGIGALLLAAPLFWIGWSLVAASEAASAVRVQSERLESLRARLSVLALGSEGDDAAAGAASIFLPGETAAIAGAALQRLVADTVEQAGGRLAEFEFAQAGASADDPGRVDLRVSLEADLVGLQGILFKLEAGVPILILDSLGVQTADGFGLAGSEDPILRVTMRVGGYWETQP